MSLPKVTEERRLSVRVRKGSALSRALAGKMDISAALHALAERLETLERINDDR